MSIQLLPFQSSESPFEVSVDVRNRLDLAFVEFAIRGDAALLAPIEEAPGRQDELWRSTCLELFTKDEDSSAYREYNFSLSGGWNCYDFNDYREGQAEAGIEEPDSIPRLGTECIRLSVALPWSELEEKLCNITAVLKMRDGSYRYYAISHTRENPDFHAPEAFTERFNMESFNVPKNTGDDRLQGILNAIDKKNND